MPVKRDFLRDIPNRELVLRLPNLRTWMGNGKLLLSLTLWWSKVSDQGYNSLKFSMVHKQAPAVLGHFVPGFYLIDAYINAYISSPLIELFPGNEPIIQTWYCEESQLVGGEPVDYLQAWPRNWTQVNREPIRGLQSSALTVRSRNPSSCHQVADHYKLQGNCSPTPPLSQPTFCPQW